MANAAKRTIYENPLLAHAVQSFRRANSVFEYQTHEEYHEEYWKIIDEGAPRDILRRKAGTEAIAEFIGKARQSKNKSPM